VAAALGGSPEERAKLARQLVEKIIVDEKRLTIKVWRSALLAGNDQGRITSRAAVLLR
jgi:hypothetical protein